MILLMKKGKSFYVFNHVQSMDDEDIWLYMKNQTEKEILYSLMDKPGATNSELSIMLHLDKSTIHKYLKKYSQKGIIQFKMDDRHKRAYLTGKANETLKRYRPDGIVESTVDS
jgi:predicted transcriptional regulator